MYPGLSQPSSAWFYGNRLQDAQTTRQRPRTKMMLEYMQKEFNIQSDTPRFSFNLHHGISLTGEVACATP